MPRPAKLPDDDATLVRDRDFLGLSLMEIAEKYDVVKSAVSMRFDRMGRPFGRQAPMDYQEYLPWKVLRDHQALDAAQRLRAHIRSMTGHPVTDAQKVRLTNWYARINRQHTVVSYDATGVPPWAYLPRTEDDGQLIIRWPEEVAKPTMEQRRVLSLPVVDAVSAM